MDAGPLVAISLVLAVLAAAGALAWRSPVILRMAGRNAVRRKTQTVVVVAGLMVGTAIISGSLASGDSLSHGIRKGAYDALGPADALLQVEGQLHFPYSVYEDLAADATVGRTVAAMSPLLYEEAALSDPVSRQSEPRVSLIGFDPAANRPFGTFRTTNGRTVDGTDLGEDEVYVLESLATSLDARPGDELRLDYAKPIPPRIPRIFTFNGSLTASAGACPVVQACQYLAGPNDAATFEVPVEPGAVAITSVVAWFGPTAERVDLDQVLRAPGGGVFANANGTPAQPDNPSVLNASGDGGLATGSWSLEVRSKAAVNQPFRALAFVFYEEYNLSALQRLAREAEAAGIDPEELRPDAFDGGGGERATVTVKAVVKPEGFGDFLLGKNVFARYDTVERLYGLEGQTNLVLVSGDLDPERGAQRVPEILDVLPRAVNASADARPDEPGIRSVKVVGIKPGWLEAADRAGNLFTEFLTTIGSFTIIAGIMLIVNIFVMLAEERKSELGMARAVGLSRRQLVLLFGFEGILYAMVATVLGVLLGIALSWGLIKGLNDIFSQSTTEGPGLLEIPFHVEPVSLVYAFAAGFLITVATVAVASWRVSRLNIVRAIRRLEEPPRRASRAVFLFGLLFLLGGLAWAAYGFLSGNFVARVLAPCLALLGAGMAATRWAPKRWAYPLAGAGVALYAGWSIFRLGNPEGLVNRVMGPVRGVFIVLAVVLILLYIPQLVRVVASLLLRVKALVPAVRPGVAYPLEKKTRTGLTVTMFALVILVVVAFSIFGATFRVDVASQTGGYDVEGDATVPVGDLRAWLDANREPGVPDPFPRIERYDELRYAIAFGGDLIRIDGEQPEYQGPPVDYVYAFDAAFAAGNEYGFESLDPAYPTARDAYEAVLADPGLVIVSTLYNFDEQGQLGAHQVGDLLTIETAGGTSEFRIIGFQKQFYLGGVWVHPQVLEANFQRVRGEYLFELRPGEDPAVAAKEIEAAFQGAGMNAVGIEEEAEKQLEQNRRFLTLFQLFLGFGLVVGIASLGIVTARSVLERRQEIGMLRAVGYSRRDILKMFYIEIFFTTTLGILVGGSIGVFTSYGVVQSTPSLESLGIEFTIPWGDILRILALVYVAVFLATFWPALRASRIPPAEAVRYIE